VKECMNGYVKWWEPLVVAFIFPIYVFLKYAFVLLIISIFAFGGIAFFHAVKDYFLFFTAGAS
jgi:hypothetical protein